MLSSKDGSEAIDIREMRPGNGGPRDPDLNLSNAGRHVVLVVVRNSNITGELVALSNLPEVLISRSARIPGIHWLA
jgi:hypothetical protein